MGEASPPVLVLVLVLVLTGFGSASASAELHTPTQTHTGTPIAIPTPTPTPTHMHAQTPARTAFVQSGQLQQCSSRCFAAPKAWRHSSTTAPLPFTLRRADRASARLTNAATADLDSDIMTTQTVKVRFTNTVTGNDVVCEALAGENLLAVGDRAGVHLPRACRNGLCGSCTCDVKDPAEAKTRKPASDSLSAPGFMTIRACQATVWLPESMSEMVVDVWRMRERKSQSGGYEIANPMTRFSDNWENEFIPAYKMGQATASSKTLCTYCSGSGVVSCVCCDGSGKMPSPSSIASPCRVCNGEGQGGCPFCQGSGQAR